MAIKLMEQKWCEEQGCAINSYIVDSESDIAKLPTCATGSTAMIADKTGGIYMVNASGEWRAV